MHAIGLPSNEKESATDTYNNMDESQKHDDEIGKTRYIRLHII